MVIYNYRNTVEKLNANDVADIIKQAKIEWKLMNYTNETFILLEV